MMNSKSFIVQVSTLGLSLLVTLSEGGAIPIYAQFGAGARPAGLGGAFTAIADDANSAIWNSANMVLASGPELTGTHTSSYLGSSFDCLAGILPVRICRTHTSIGFYLLRAATENIPITPSTSDTVSEVPSSGSGSFETIYAALGVGARLSKLVLLGIGANLVRTRLLQSVASGRGFRVSLSLDATRKGTPLGRTTLSVQIRNIGGRLSWSSGHSEFESPRLVFSVAHRPWVNDKLIITTDLEKSLWAAQPHFDWRCGLEFLMVHSIPLRFGYDGESTAAGIGCKGKHISVDYALSFHRELAESHCVSLTLSK